MYKLKYTALFEKKVKEFRKDKELVDFGHRKNIYNIAVFFARKGKLI